MGSARSRQYLLAAAIGLSVFAWQVYSMLHPLAQHLMGVSEASMQQQLLRRLVEDSGALLLLTAYFLVATVAHVLLTLVVMAAYRVAAARWLPRYLDSVGISIAFVCLSLLAAAFVNRFAFPMSRAFPGVELAMLQVASPLLVWGSILLVGLVLVAALAELVRRRWRIMTAAAVVIGLAYSLSGMADGVASSGREQPDIIILGVDSLRPDFLPAFGFQWSGLTPSINAAVGDSVVFRDARTPLARTFVSYMSLLTGSYPREHGARFNLYPRFGFSRSGTIAHLLQKEGYHSVFAMDDSRFANFDESFGFDETVMPPVGALDFTIGSTYDFLATNLLLLLPQVNERFGYVYGNRAAFRTYRSPDHPGRVVEAIRRSPASKPLFIVSHLCLPHWPYAPVSVLERDLVGTRVMSLNGFNDAPSPYVRALAQVDQQFGLIINALRRAGRLDNAIVIVLSDHGESFGMARDAFRDMDADGKAVSFFGHGGFALSDRQHKIVLAMQRYDGGRPLWRARTVSGEASIIDVAPTIRDMAGRRPEWAMTDRSGASLRTVLEDGSITMPARTLFVESGIRSASVEKTRIDEKEVASEMSYLYRIEPDLRFEIRADQLDRQLAQKQRGAIRGALGVSTVPVDDLSSVEKSCWIVADYEERTVRCDDYPSADLRVAELQESVCEHFAGDRGFDSKWCARIAR